MARLGDLERTVMRALWDAGAPLTGREVAAALARPDLAYTTVLTVLTRLEHKGLVRRDSSSKAHSYAPVASREHHVSELLGQALDQADNRLAALQHFAQALTAEEAAALRQALDGD